MFTQICLGFGNAWPRNGAKLIRDFQNIAGIFDEAVRSLVSKRLEKRQGYAKVFNGRSLRVISTRPSITAIRAVASSVK